MGTGSGILAETSLRFINKKNILTADINQESVKLLKQKKFKSIKSNLFQKITKTKKFHLITFNAPYLKEHKYDKKQDTTGGKDGDETALKFLTQAKQYLTSDGKIFLLISSHTPQKKIKKFNPKIVAKKKLFFEELLILELNKNKLSIK